MLETLSPASSGRLPVHSTFALCFEGIVADRLRTAGATVHVLGAVHARQMSEIRHARRALSECCSRIAGTPLSSTRHGRRRSSVPRFSTAAHRWCAGCTRRSLVRGCSSSGPAARVLRWCCATASTPPITAAPRSPAYRTSVQYPPAALRARRPEVRDRVRESLGTPGDAIVVALAARLEAGKGQSQLIEALRNWATAAGKRGSSAGHNSPTSAPTWTACGDQAGAAGLASRIRFLGQRSDVADLFEAADVYCQPNIAPDSFGLSFIEALSAGLPVVTTRLGAAAEIVDTSCGVLVEPGSLRGTARCARHADRRC